VAAIELLSPKLGETLLEIGCGTGQSVQTVLALAPTAKIHAIDRSEKAVARARIVNEAAVKSGQAVIAVGDIEKAPVEPGTFDRIFAIPVNSFWTKPGLALPHAAAGLRPGGELWIIYDEWPDKVTEPIVESLEAFGMQNVRTRSATGAFAIIAER
jgi:SAM-dependent methyltransferase